MNKKIIVREKNTRKKSLITITFAVLLSLCFSLAGCESLPISGVSNVVNNYEVLNLTLNADETYTIDVNTQFKDSGIDFVKYTLKSSDEKVITIKNNVLTAVDAGFASIQVTLYKIGKSPDGGKAYDTYYTNSANVYVINEATMTAVTTAQQLSDMRNNLDGKYILKADIDLKDWTDWEPIGSSPLGYEFRGMFVNPNGYTINNLTITSSTNSTHYAGLFGSVKYACIVGIILDNLFIDVTDFEGQFPSAAGGVAGASLCSYFINCRINGEVYAQRSAGGIVGSDSVGQYRNCEFTGVVKSQHIGQAISDYGAGGIAGFFGCHLDDEGVIIDCKVDATVTSSVSAGGIAGVVFYEELIQNCTFIGLFSGEMNQGEMYGYKKH